MDADKPNSLVAQIQSLTGIEGDEFKDFVQEIMANADTDIKTVDDLRIALAAYLQKQMGDVLNNSH